MFTNVSIIIVHFGDYLELQFGSFMSNFIEVSLPKYRQDDFTRL